MHYTGRPAFVLCDGVIVNELHMVNQTVLVRCLFLYVSAISFIENNPHLDRI